MSIVTDSTNMVTQIQSGAVPTIKLFAVFAAVIGAFIIVGVGFAGPEVLHNAAHDLRHGLAFPCH